MALQKNIQVPDFALQNGQLRQLSNAYIKIVSTSTVDNCIEYRVVVYTQKGGDGVHTYQYSCLLSSGDLVTQGYEHLKTLPEFAGATDC